jgi:hypothetical protein
MRVLFAIAVVFGLLAVALGVIAASELEAEYIQPDGFRIKTWVGAVGSALGCVIAFAAGLILHQRRR